MEITQVKKEKRGTGLVDGLLAVWESSVRATHLFLREGDVDYLRPFVEQGLQEVPLLFYAEESQDHPLSGWLAQPYKGMVLTRA